MSLFLTLGNTLESTEVSPKGTKLCGVREPAPQSCQRGTRAGEGPPALLLPGKVPTPSSLGECVLSLRLIRGWRDDEASHPWPWRLCSRLTAQPKHTALPSCTGAAGTRASQWLRVTVCSLEAAELSQWPRLLPLALCPWQQQRLHTCSGDGFVSVLWLPGNSHNTKHWKVTCISLCLTKLWYILHRIHCPARQNVDV